MNDKIEGLVIKINDYRDNDLLLSVLTKEYGIISLVGKSSKKINSKQRFFICCLYEFIIDYKTNKTMFAIHGSKMIRSYYDLDSTENLSFKNIFLEIIYKSREFITSETYKNTIFFMEQFTNVNKYLLGSLLISYMCKLHGIVPNVDECVVCKSKKIVNISNSLGGFVCGRHNNSTMFLSLDNLKHFRLIVKASFNNYDQIKNNAFSFDDFRLIINFFIENSFLSLKTYDFYKTII